MMGLLFLCASLRALAVLGSEGIPQWWAQDAMMLATFTLLVQTLMHLFGLCFDSHDWHEMQVVQRLVWGIRFFFMLITYAALAVVGAAVLSLGHGRQEVPALALNTACTMALAGVYFFMY